MGDNGTASSAPPPARPSATPAKTNFFTKLVDGSFVAKRPRIATGIIIVLAAVLIFKHIRARGFLGYGKKKALKAKAAPKRPSAVEGEPEEGAAASDAPDKETAALIQSINSP